MKNKERMEPITSNGAELVRLSPGELVDLAPVGSVQITVFIMTRGRTHCEMKFTDH